MPETGRFSNFVKKNIYQIITIFIAAVWIINGLFAKVLNYVPRHQEIVARILGSEYSEILIIFIGVGEIILAIWFVSGFFRKFNAGLQITLIATMNILEFIFARDLLLWGGLNAFIALVFILVIFYNEFILRKQIIEK
jgi:hypothetical protein